jgi:hypothetical protein
MMYRNRRKFHFPFFPIIPIAAALLFGLIVMLLWNAILPAALNAGTLNYWQAVGLLVLCRILFGGFKGRPGYQSQHGWRGGPPWRRKWMNMSEEEKVKFREEWKKRCNPPNQQQQ